MTPSATVGPHPGASGTDSLKRPLTLLFLAVLLLACVAPPLIGREGELLLDSLIFAGNGNPVRDVMVGGRWRVREGHHALEEPVLEAYRAVISDLAESAG